MSSRLGLFFLAVATLAACRDNVGSGPKDLRGILSAPPVTAGGALAGKTIAFLATDGFEEAELVRARELLAERGARTLVVSPKASTIQGYRHLERGARVAVDLTLDQADATFFDGLVLPGGVANPDALRADARAVRFVRAFTEHNLVVAAICHAPWMLIEAGAVRDRTMTSWPSLKMDLLNAGAVWVDRDVQSDNGIVTSRRLEDIDAFVTKTSEALLDPAHQKHAAR